MYQSCKDKKAYTDRMERMKKENLRELSEKHDHTDRRNFLKALKAGQFGAAKKLMLKHLCWMIREGKRKASSFCLAIIQGKPGKNQAPKGENAAPDYFSNEKIAVYTVIFGDYDVLYEPKCHPDNCSFFLISDNVRPLRDSVWQQFELSEEIEDRLSGMNNTEKNRFLKMMPHLLFPDFVYSVYLDGNIRLVTDPTEFINRMPECGFSAHRHVSRECVYKEAIAIKALKKAPEKAMEELVRYLKAEKMPANYGLPECPVLVRRHNQPECIKLMEEWWGLFERFPYRDQMLLPLVLYRNGIRTEDIAWLGKNVRFSPSFRRYLHPEREQKVTVSTL